LKQAVSLFCTVIVIFAILSASLVRAERITPEPAPLNTTLSSMMVTGQNQNVSDSSFYRQSINRDGYAPTEAPDTPDLLWAFNLNDSITTSPAVADGKVFVGTSSGRLYALDLTTGDIIWTFNAGSPISAAPAYYDGLVFFGTKNPGEIYAVDASTGLANWLYEVPQGAAVYSSAAVVNGMVIAGSSDGILLCLNESDGQLLWDTHVGSGYPSSPAVQNGTVFVSTTIGVYAVDMTGTLIWHYGTTWPVTSCPAVADGLVFVAEENNDHLYALNENTGQSVWNLWTGGWLTPPAVDSSKQLVIVGSKDFTLYCLNEYTGSVKWKYVNGPNYLADPTISANGLVYVGTFDGNLHCLNEDTGQEVWNYNLTAPPVSSATLIPQHALVGTQDGTIYCFGPAFTIHSIVISNLTASSLEVGQGYSLNISATVQNNGDYEENFNVTAYANGTAINTEGVALMNGSSTVVSFAWDTTGLAYGNYTISAYATPVPDQTNTTNNSAIAGQVLITIPGDLNGDFTVGLSDLVTLAKAYGSRPSDPNWNPNADIDGNGAVGLSDLVILAQHYGQHYP
jgi:outer membrane protein assembly factor BamB